jgi:putative oxidoreductase
VSGRTSSMISPRVVYASWAAQAACSLVLLQGMFLKFSAHPNSVQLFSYLGVEPWGRFAFASVELTLALLVLIPRTATRAALCAAVLHAFLLVFKLAALEGGADRGFVIRMVLIALAMLLSLVVLFARRLVSGMSKLQLV